MVASRSYWAQRRFSTHFQGGKAMLFPAMVETYAILSLLISILAVIGIQV